MRFMKVLPALAAVLMSASCLGGSTELIVAPGTYALATVNGKPLPFDYGNGAIVVSEVLTLNGDGTYGDVITRPNSVVLTDVGNYNSFGTTVNFADLTLGAVYQGVISGNTLTITIGNYVEVFNKTK
jgi:hypothetical protein